MFLLALLISHHVPVEQYLKCDDYLWLKEGLEEVDFFTPAEKSEILIKWINHTDPKCFTQDAND